MINALNKPSDEKNYADAAAQFAYRAYGFSGDQYNYIVSSIDKQFMEIIKMEMMYQEFIAQRGDYFEEKYPDDESKWESYAAWTNDLNKLNEDVAKAMDTMLDREILVSDSTVGSIRMKLDEFVKPEDMVSVRMKNENYHEKLTGEFYENEQPIIDAFNEGYLYLIEEYGWKSNADVITPFINFHRIAVPTPKTEENPSGIDIYYIFDTSQPHDAEEDWAWNSDDSVPENLRFYQFEEKIDLTLARDQHIPSCDFINLTKENYSDGQNQFSCAKSTAEFQSLFATGLFSALSSIPGDYLSEYLLTKKDTKTYIALSDYDFDYHDAWATSYTIFHVVDTTGQYPGSSLESSTLSAEKIQPDKSAGAYSAYTVILKNRPQEDGYYKTKVDVATNGVGDTELEMVQEDGTICQENIVPSGKEVTLRFKAEGTTVLESITLQRHNNTENPSEVTSEETLLTKDQIATLSPDEEGYYTYTYSAPYSNATFVLNGAVGHGLTVSDYAERFYESHNYGYGPDKDGTILLISMEDHDWYMATYGYAITVFTDAGIQYIGEEMTGDLSDGDFAAAFDTFADECDDFITQAKTGEPYDIDNEPQKPMSWIWIPISLVAGIVLSLIVVGTMKSKLKTVRFQAAANNYVKAGSMNLTESRDIFLYNTMTKTKKEKNDSHSGGGGSSTHTTSSGSTAGGGGGKF